MFIFFKNIVYKNVNNARTRFFRSKNPQFSILNCEHNLHAFVLGTMLGDAYITKYGRLQIDQCSYEYTKWKFNFLLNFNLVTEKTKISTVKRIHTVTKKLSISYRFYSKPCFMQWRAAFYKKSIMKNMKKKIQKYYQKI